MLAAISQEILAYCTGSTEAGLLAKVVALVLKSAAPSDTQCLCSDYNVNFTVFSSVHTQLWLTLKDVWDACGPRCDGNFALLGAAPFCKGVISRDRGMQLFMPQTRLFLE